MEGINQTSSRNKETLKKDNDKPFYVKKFQQANTIPGKIKSRIGIIFYALPFLGSFFFLFSLIYANIYIKIVVILIAILQNLISNRVQIYFNLVKFFEMQKYYKSFTYISEAEIDPKHSIFPVHPHGIIGNVISASIINCHEPLEKAKIFGTRLVRILPIGGLFARMIGIEGVNNSNFKKTMQKGENIIFIPGGFECATITDDTKDRIFIMKRKGFIKYCLIYGYRIYPVYNFGENRLYYTFKRWKIIEKIGLILNKYKLPGTVFIGKYVIFPRDDIDVCTVVGKPLQLPLIENPTDEEIDFYHTLYIQRLDELYNKYKDEFGASNKLEIM